LTLTMAFSGQEAAEAVVRLKGGLNDKH